MTTRTMVYDVHGRELSVTRMVARGWLAGDDVDELGDASIVCPIVVDVAGGGRIHGLLVEKAGRRVVVYWCRYLNTFRALEPLEVTS